MIHKLFGYRGPRSGDLFVENSKC